MEILEGVLREELGNSRRRLVSFKKELRKLPKGSIHRKEINGRKYYYHVRWNKKAKKNDFDLLGEQVPESVLKQYESAKNKRANYRNQIRILKLEVQFLKRALRAREFSIAKECARKAA